MEAAMEAIVFDWLILDMWLRGVGTTQEAQRERGISVFIVKVCIPHSNRKDTMSPEQLPLAQKVPISHILTLCMSLSFPHSWVLTLNKESNPSRDTFLWNTVILLRGFAASHTYKAHTFCFYLMKPYELHVLRKSTHTFTPLRVRCVLEVGIITLHRRWNNKPAPGVP